MWRHTDFRKFITLGATISLAGVIFGYLVSPATAITVAITSALLLGTMLLFTRRRYLHIKRLSQFLRKIRSGDYTLDVRDNDEGELSILKSEIFKVTTRLQEQSNQLQADKVHLTNAIADISHQLRTPLTSMTMMADLLNSDRLPIEKREEFTRTIRVQLERIEWLVSALLKLSKIDAGTANFTKETVLVKEMLTDALESVSVPIDVKSIALRVDGDPATTANIDIKWTTEVFINIFKNAVSHLPTGGSLRIAYEKNALYTEITIQDDGPGIPKEDLPYIFKRFYRGKNANEDSVGIGLAMAYQIIKEQGGDITVASSPESGTAFRVKFYT